MLWPDWEPTERFQRIREVLTRRPVTFGINLLSLPDQPIPLYVMELEEHLRWIISRDGLMHTLNCTLADRAKLIEANTKLVDELETLKSKISAAARDEMLR